MPEKKAERKIKKQKSEWLRLTRDRMAPADGFGCRHEEVMSSAL